MIDARVLAVNLVVLVSGTTASNWQIMSGDQYCETVGTACVSDAVGRGVDATKSCTMKALVPMVLSTELFSLQDGFGILTVNGETYTGSDGPVDVLVAQGAIVEFISSPYVDSPPPEPSPPPPPFPPSMPPPSPSPPPPPVTPLGPPFTSEIQVGGGSYPTEVSWTLTCDDGTSLSGDSPTDIIAEVREMSTCTLTMLDSYGDGWNGDVWTGFNQEYTLEAPTPPYYPGQTQVVTFQVVIPPPAPPFIAPPPSAPSTYMELQVTSGTWPSEISFTLACNNELVVSGGAPFPPTLFALAVGVNCTLTMMDAYADGWNGAVFTLGNLVSTTLETGAAEKYYFTIPVPSASSPPVPPSSPQLFKDVHSPSESCDHIRSLSDCSAAAEALGFDDTSPTDDHTVFNAPTYLPPGCYYYAGSLLINQAGTNTGDCTEHFACLCWQSAPPPPPLMFTNISVSGGTYASEISWTLTCNDGFELSGGGTFAQTVPVPLSVVTCTLEMSDSYGDGWNGNYFYAFGKSFTLPSGSSGTVTFSTLPDPPAAPPGISPPPLSPPSPPPPPLPPHAPLAYSSVAVSVGSFPSEISWAYSCDDGSTMSGGAPFGPASLAVSVGALCTLSMSDAHGDGWNGAVWYGFGQTGTLAYGVASGNMTFYGIAAPPPPRPPPPPIIGFKLCGVVAVPPSSPPSAPSPPPFPPLSPGSKTQQVVSVTVQFAGTVDDFLEEQKTFKREVAFSLGIPPENVDVIVTSGSIMVEVRITPTLGVPLQTIIGGTTRAINTATGATTLTLEGEVPEANVVTVVATPTPIDSTTLGLSNEDGSSSTAIGIGLGIGIPVVVLALVAIFMVMKKGGATKSTTVVNTISVPIDIAKVSATSSSGETTTASAAVEMEEKL